MKIVPDPRQGSHRTGRIEGLTKKEIDAILGFTPNVADDPDKVKYSWGFTVDGKQFGIWDYYRSYAVKSWSTYGDSAVLKKIFGDKYIP